MDKLFNQEIDLSEAISYISRYNSTKLYLFGEIKTQKGFQVVADGPTLNGYHQHWYCVFPTFIIRYMTGPGLIRSYEIEKHTLSLYALNSLKLSKICYYNDSIQTVISRFESFHLPVEQYYKEVIKEVKLDNDKLEKELTKYKGIIENFRKELSPYQF